MPDYPTANFSESEGGLFSLSQIQHLMRVEFNRAQRYEYPITCMLIAVDRLDGYAWMAVVIVGRELAVTGLRGIASAGGRVMPASWLGKAKALSQNSAIVALLFYYPQMGLPGREIGLVLLALATVLTLWSGYLYFADYFGSNLENADEAERT